MQQSYDELVAHLGKCRVRGRKRVEQIMAVLCAQSVDGPVFGQEGAFIASIVQSALDESEGKAQPKKKAAKAEDTTNHAAAAEVLKHIQVKYEESFSARFEANYGYEVPKIRRLMDKGETADGLKHYVDAWIRAGKNELVHGDNFTNARIWGDANVKSFIANLNRIKSLAGQPKTPEKKWVVKSEPNI